MKNYILIGLVIAALYIFVFKGEKAKGRTALKNIGKMDIFTDAFFNMIVKKFGQYYKASYINALLEEAREIHDAKGIFVDSDGKALDAIRGFQSKAEACLVSKVMQVRYGTSLPSYIGFMDAESKQIAYSLLNSLPVFVSPKSKDLPPPTDDSTMQKIKNLFL